MNHTSSDGKGKPPRRLPLLLRLAAVTAAVGLAVGLTGFGLLAWGYGDAAESVVTSPPREFRPGPVTALLDPVPPSYGDSDPTVRDSGPTTVFGEITIRSGDADDVLTGHAEARPVRLIIDSIGVDAPIDGVGYAVGEMEVPASAGVVGWYEHGPAPGETGSSVLAAHVDWGGRRGVFFELRNLSPGAIVIVEFEDGSSRLFQAVSLTSYGKTDLPTDQIFTRAGPAVLTLITCGGPFNPSLNSYRDNVVALATELERPGIIE